MQDSHRSRPPSLDTETERDEPGDPDSSISKERARDRKRENVPRKL